MAIEQPAFNDQPKMDHIRDFDPSKALVLYDDASDTLFVRLAPQRPAVSVPLDDDFLYLLVDPTTKQVIGFQIEDLLHAAVVEYPEWLQLAEVAGVDRQRRAAAIGLLVRRVEEVLR